LQGLQGLHGFAAAQGLQGLQGLAAAQGLQGLQGLAAAQGLQGLQALTAQGLQGLQAANCTGVSAAWAAGSTTPPVSTAAALKAMAVPFSVLRMDFDITLSPNLIGQGETFGFHRETRAIDGQHANAGAADP
jgi:hypothetical protein